MKLLGHLVRYDIRHLWKQTLFMCALQIALSSAVLIAANNTAHFGSRDHMVTMLLTMILAAT
jgi:hypothetical protein